MVSMMLPDGVLDIFDDIIDALGDIPLAFPEDFSLLA